MACHIAMSWNVMKGRPWRQDLGAAWRGVAFLVTSLDFEVGGQDEYEVINAVQSGRINKPRGAGEFDSSGNEQANQESADSTIDIYTM